MGRPPCWDPASSGRLAAYDPSTVGYSVVLAGGLVVVHLLRSAVCGDHVRGSGVAAWVADMALRLWFPLQYAVLWLGPAGRLPGVRG